MLLLHLSRTPIFCNKNVAEVREDAGLGSSFDSICGLYRCYHKASVKVSVFGEVFSEFLTEGTGWVEVPWTGNVLCFHPDFGSTFPGTNIESQHSRALRGQSGVSTGPGDEVKVGKFHRDHSLPDWSPQKRWWIVRELPENPLNLGLGILVICPYGVLTVVSRSVPFWTSHGKSQIFLVNTIRNQKWWMSGKD